MANNPEIDVRRIAVIAGGVLALLVLSVFVWSWLPPPSMGTDEEVFKTVDALFTALTSRNTDWMDDCEQRLRVFQDEARLPPKSARYLDAVIAQARTGEREQAARRLYDFIYRQRAPA